ncbi:MAG TPA: efflux RND transporter periplasmic adaptor subunit [Planctomycetota bacterium]|nr:efflux RND transporter periplasmic adaptor subunit [Planctomycetota bacterium]
MLAVAGGRAVPSSSTSEKTPTAPAPTPVRIRAEGRIVARPGAKVTVGAEQSGRVVRVLVAESSEVKAGDLVAELDSELAKAELEQARSRVGQARSRVGQARSRVEDAKRTHDYLSRELERALAMAKANLLSDKDAGRARQDATNAATRVEQAESEVQQAESEVARLEIVLKKTRVVAPISGVVVQRFTSEGETLAPGAPVATIVDLARLRVEAEVDEIDAPSLGQGTPVTIVSESAPGQSWRGSVEQIPSAVVRRDLRGEETERPQDMPVLLVKIAVTEPLPLRLGQEVSVFVGSEPPPLARQHPAAPEASSSLADPAAALLLDPVSREAVSAALTTIFGTLFFVMLRRKLASGFQNDEDENPGETATANAQEEEEHDDGDSDEGALDGLSEEDVIVLDDSDEDSAPRKKRRVSARAARRT